MGRRKGIHAAVYGSVRIKRGWCPDCRTWAFIVRGKQQCCDRPVSGVADGQVRVCDASGVRKYPGKEIRERLLAKFEYRCAYCRQMFGTHITYKGKDRVLAVNFDHQVPFAYLQDNPKDNWLPACRVCNGLKGSLCFESLEATREYLVRRWAENAPDVHLSDLPCEGDRDANHASVL